MTTIKSFLFAALMVLSTTAFAVIHFGTGYMDKETNAGQIHFGPGLMDDEDEGEDPGHIHFGPGFNEEDPGQIHFGPGEEG